jgi:hypothetical protein
MMIGSGFDDIDLLAFPSKFSYSFAVNEDWLQLDGHSRISLCLYVYPLSVLVQRPDRDVTAARNTQQQKNCSPLFVLC